MSLKDDINSVKRELNTEEQFLESFVKVERFFKKNKTVLIGAVVVIVIAFVSMNISDYVKADNKSAANIAFNKILNNPNDQESLSILKEKNTKLYEIAQYLQAQKENKISNINVEFLKELNEYEKALKDNSIQELNTVSMKSDFLLKEFAIFNKALIQTEKGQYNDAKETLKLIPETSKVNELVKLLNHYLITKV